MAKYKRQSYCQAEQWYFISKNSFIQNKKSPEIKFPDFLLSLLDCRLKQSYVKAYLFPLEAVMFPN
jgi:hypothetical protein